jgi:hypothetical protein
MSMQQVRSQIRQSGNLYELPLIGLTLFVAGILLGDIHAEYYFLCAVGLGAIAMPYINHRRYTAFNRNRLQEVVEELREGGFNTGHMLNSLDYDHALAFEPGNTGKIAWISMDDIYIREKTDIFMVKMVAIDRTSTGGMPDILYTIRVSAKHNICRDYGHPLRWFARKRMQELKNYVASDTLFIEE